VALAIFSLAAAMAAGTFWSVLKAWTRGGEMLEQLHYGEFAMEQLVTAMRGAAWFPSKPEAFGFWLERGGTGRNKASWVTSGTAFLPPDSPLRNGLHRLSVTVDRPGRARPGGARLAARLTEDATKTTPKAWLVVSRSVEEFSCEWYDFDMDSWSTDWEETNSLPKLVRVTLTMKKRAEFDEELELQRLVELEVAPALPGRERRDRTTDVPAAETPATSAPATNAPAAGRRRRARASAGRSWWRPGERGDRRRRGRRRTMKFSTPWKSFFHTVEKNARFFHAMENFSAIFPRHGKSGGGRTTRWKTKTGTRASRLHFDPTLEPPTPSSGGDGRRGAALVVALWTVLILSLLIGGLAYEMHIEAGITSYARKRLKAQVAARGGWSTRSSCSRKASRRARSRRATRRRKPAHPLEEPEPRHRRSRGCGWRWARRRPWWTSSPRRGGGT
jgi:hypothetical protein